MALTTRDAEPSPTAWRGMLWAFVFGNFVIGSGVMVVAGTLTDISHSLNVSAADTGILISLASLTICVSAPLLASLTQRVDRRLLLTACLLWYGVMHVAEALAPDLTVLTVLRVLSVLAAALFTPQAAASVGVLAPAQTRGQAITFIFLGWSLASVLGMPMSSLLGTLWGWRPTFALIGALSLVAAIWVWHSVPGQVRPPAMNLRVWRTLLRYRPAVLCIASSALFSGGQFLLLAFFSPFFRDEMHLSAAQLAALFGWFGLLGFLGNAWMSRVVDRLTPERGVMFSLMAVALSLLLWPLGGQSMVLLWLVIAPWGLAIFALNSSQQARLVQMAPHLGSATVALNASAMYGGQAIGAATGSVLIGAHRIAEMSWWALAAVLLAMLVSHAAHRDRHRRGALADYLS